MGSVNAVKYSIGSRAKVTPLFENRAVVVPMAKNIRTLRAARSRAPAPIPWPRGPARRPPPSLRPPAARSESKGGGAKTRCVEHVIV